MDILFITDYVCPYCLVAKEALQQALRLLGLEANITYHPYELTPEPRPRIDTFSDPVRRKKYMVLERPCRELGLDMKLPPNIVPRPYTRLAFEGWFFAKERGVGDIYADLVYRAYFIHERNIEQIDVLADLAAQAGLNAADFRAALEQGIYTRAEREAVEYTRNALKPVSVPTIYVNGEKIALRDYSLSEMVSILSGAASLEGPGFSCGSGSC